MSIKIIRLEIENFMRIKTARMKPAGSMTIIGGDNGQGKSSALKAIAAVFGGKRSAPKQPLREGAEDGRILLETDDFTVTAVFDSDTWKMRVKSKEGAVFPSPQALLDRLYTKLSFDVAEFARMDKAEQAATLRRLLAINDSENLRQREGYYSERRDTNRDLKKIEAQLKGMPSHESVEPVDTDALWEDLARAEHTVQRADEHNKRIDHAMEMASKIQAEIEQLQNKLCEYQETASSARIVDLPDVSAIKAKIKAADETNQQVREHKERARLAKHRDALVDTSASLTQYIDELDEARQKVLRDAEFPIDGLGLSDDGVTYSGLPFEQASDGEQLRVSVAMGLALNPELGVLLIRNGSLLGPSNLAMIEEMAAAAGVDVWVEKVTTDASECSFLMENGSIKGAAQNVT